MEIMTSPSHQVKFIIQCLWSPLDSNNDKLFIRIFHPTFGQCSKPVKVSLLLYTHRGALCGIFQLIPIIEIYNSLKKRRVQKKCPLWQWNVALTITCCLSPKSCPLFYKLMVGDYPMLSELQAIFHKIVTPFLASA